MTTVLFYEGGIEEFETVNDAMKALETREGIITNF